MAETRALDSFQQLHCSILQFEELYGRKPGDVTVIDHQFKDATFLELRFSTLTGMGWTECIGLSGIDPPFENKKREREAEEGDF